MQFYKNTRYGGWPERLWHDNNNRNEAVVLLCRWVYINKTRRPVCRKLLVGVFSHEDTEHQCTYREELLRCSNSSLWRELLNTFPHIYITQKANTTAKPPQPHLLLLDRNLTHDEICTFNNTANVSYYASYTADNLIVSTQPTKYYKYCFTCHLHNSWRLIVLHTVISSTVACFDVPPCTSINPPPPVPRLVPIAYLNEYDGGIVRWTLPFRM